MKTKTLRLVFFFPLALVSAYLFKEALYSVFGSNHFSRNILIWLITVYIFMLTLVSIIPKYKNECLKYSFNIILFYSIAYLLVLYSTWEINGSFDVINTSIPIGCIVGSTLTFFLLKDSFRDKEESIKLIESDQNFFFDILPIKEQQALKDQAQRELMAEYEAQGVEEYVISNSEIITRAIFIFENDEMIVHNKLKETDPQPLEKKFTEVETSEISIGNPKLTRAEKLLLQTMKDRKNKNKPTSAV